VTDDEIVAAMKLLLERCKIVTEPASAACVAALLNGAARGAKRVCCVISGGNVDLAKLKGWL
jgi:threonine dehydratase